jgi:hypothetical protein
MYNLNTTDLMGKTEYITTHNIVKFKCSACHLNTIYIKVLNYEINTAPFKPDEYVCTECNQGMLQTTNKA